MIQNKDLVEGELYKATTGYSIWRYNPSVRDHKCLVIEKFHFRHLGMAPGPHLEPSQDEKDWYNYCETVNCVPFETFLQKKVTTSPTIYLYPLNP
jgi:hypothetical protein